MMQTGIGGRRVLGGRGKKGGFEGGILALNSHSLTAMEPAETHRAIGSAPDEET